MEYIIIGNGGERAIIKTDNLKKWLNDNPTMRKNKIMPYWVYEAQQQEFRDRINRSILRE